MLSTACARVACRNRRVQSNFMPITYLDQEIELLVRERKLLPDNWESRIRLIPKRGHSERQLDVGGEANSQFRIILRQGHINALDFSVILAVRTPSSNQLFRLRRNVGSPCISHLYTISYGRFERRPDSPPSHDWRRSTFFARMRQDAGKVLESCCRRQAAGVGRSAKTATVSRGDILSK